ncbi:squalene/phytoene synthase family protein [Gymnodinialimonas ulvae]|uniref:squalene/phytoene synthase family protein n=1 Tax=Gymnodinialimonas ulvae TaxID=3126504 RepID=UPI003099BD0D
MSVQACADLVARGDPRRFRAAMAAPLAAREILLPLYAFNIEVSRAPWLTEEPMIAEMRLQWWRDALEEVALGKGRRHEVVDALGFLDADGAARLDQLVAARRWDIYKDAFEDAAHFDEYLDRTGSALIEAGCRALGGRPDATTKAIGRANALARYLCAVPELEVRGRMPLVDGRPAAIATLARNALADLPRRLPSGPAAPVLFEAAGARSILIRAARDPMAVAEGRLEGSPLAERWALIRAATLRRL